MNDNICALPGEVQRGVRQKDRASRFADSVYDLIDEWRKREGITPGEVVGVLEWVKLDVFYGAEDTPPEGGEK